LRINDKLAFSTFKMLSLWRGRERNEDTEKKSKRWRWGERRYWQI